MSYVSKTIITDEEKIKLYPNGKCPTIVMEMQTNGSLKAIEVDNYKDEFGNDVKTKDYANPL